MQKSTSIVLLIAGKLLFVCGTVLAVMLYNLDFFSIDLVPGLHVGLAAAIAFVGGIMVVAGIRGLRSSRSDRSEARHVM